VKIKIRPEHASMLQMNDWLAELQDGENAEPTGPGYAVPAGHGCAEPAAGNARPDALAGPAAPATPVAAAAPVRTATPAAPAAPAGPAQAAERAVIGDQLRMPIMWCEMGSCVSWHADPAATGEADTRARAIDAGWRIDALGRLACPQCQQTDPGYWAARPVVPWDRSMAVARTGPIPAAPRSSRDPGRPASGYPPPSRAERSCGPCSARGRHRLPRPGTRAGQAGTGSGT
jgi:hypothetical protein